MTNRVLYVKIMSRPCAGEMAFIPRYKLISYYHLNCIEYNFPVRLAFGMTINKSQGQSLETVGLDLRNSVFGHGVRTTLLTKPQ